MQHTADGYYDIYSPWCVLHRVLNIRKDMEPCVQATLIASVALVIYAYFMSNKTNTLIKKYEDDD